MQLFEYHTFHLFLIEKAKNKVSDGNSIVYCTISCTNSLVRLPISHHIVEEWHWTGHLIFWATLFSLITGENTDKYTPVLQRQKYHLPRRFIVNSKWLKPSLVFRAVKASKVTKCLVSTLQKCSMSTGSKCAMKRIKTWQSDDWINLGGFLLGK